MNPSSGAAGGMLLGGVLTQYLTWRWCLYVNIPIALVAAFGAWTVLPEFRPTSGAVMGRAQDERTAAPVRLLRIVLDRQRGPAYLSAFLAIAGMFGAFLFLTYELQVVLGFAPFQAGLAFLPMSASTLVVATVIAPRLLPRVAPRLLMVPGFLLAAAGMAILTQLRVDSGYLTDILPAEILLGLGIACVMVPAASLATSGVEQREAGLASATLNSAQQVGASLGTAVLNTLAASVTATYLTANALATRADGLVHGYAAAAMLGALLLIAGAAVSASLGRN